MQCEAGYDIIIILDEVKEFREYRDEDATYDDAHFSIPFDVFHRLTKISREEIVTLNGNLESYSGGIMLIDELVLIHGGA